MQTVAAQTLILSYTHKENLNQYIFEVDSASDANFRWWDQEIKKLIAIGQKQKLVRKDLDADMQWKTHYIRKTDAPKTVHIIGGGIGGMEAARVLALRGHKPVIHEKSDRLGGTFIPASAESYKSKLRELLAWYIREMEKLGVQICFGENISDLSAFDGEHVIVATGSTPRVLRSVPGHEKMIEACGYLTGTPVGQRVCAARPSVTLLVLGMKKARCKNASCFWIIEIKYPVSIQSKP